MQHFFVELIMCGSKMLIRVPQWCAPSHLNFDKYKFESRVPCFSMSCNLTFACSISLLQISQKNDGEAT